MSKINAVKHNERITSDKYWRNCIELNTKVYVKNECLSILELNNHYEIKVNGQLN